MAPIFFPRRRFLYLSASAALTAGCAGNRAQPVTCLAPATTTWDEVVNLARGTTVSWAMWGGSDQTKA